MEALSREPGDIRCNNAMGLLLIRKGQFVKAEPFLRKAIETQIERSPNPYDGEPHYNLGWCLNMQGRKDEAYSAFFKSTWNAAWQDSGYYA
jgi:Flp pilus assembly protein TadD